MASSASGSTACAATSWPLLTRQAGAANSTSSTTARARLLGRPSRGPSRRLNGLRGDLWAALYPAGQHTEPSQHLRSPRATSGPLLPQQAGMASSSSSSPVCAATQADSSRAADSKPLASSANDLTTRPVSRLARSRPAGPWQPPCELPAPTPWWGGAPTGPPSRRGGGRPHRLRGDIWDAVLAACCVPPLHCLRSLKMA